MKTKEIESRIGEHHKKESDIKVGDTVIIGLKLLNSFESYCDDESNIPKHNYGVVTKIIKPRDKDDKGRNLHPSPYTIFGNYNFIVFEMPNKEEIGLYSSDLRKLY